MLKVIPIETVGVTEDRSGLLEEHCVLLQIAESLAGVPDNRIAYIH